MIVAITDGRANISLKRSTDPEGAATDAPRPSSQELKVKFLTLIAPLDDNGPYFLILLKNLCRAYLVSNASKVP
jgi:magnesium chelatase subunit D